jgi:hypothetical protein
MFAGLAKRSGIGEGDGDREKADVGSAPRQ